MASLRVLGTIPEKLMNTCAVNQVEGGETSSHPCASLQTPSKDNSVIKRIKSSTDLTSDLFRELYDPFETLDQFDVSLGGVVPDLQEEWYGSFAQCLNS